MIVVDAGVGVTALLDDDEDGERVRARLRGERLLAPELFDLEVMSVIRRLRQANRLGSRRAAQAVDDLANLRLRRVSHRPFLERCWELRDNLTPYDAAYVALAERFDVMLVTGDARLAGSPGPTCHFDLLATP